MSFDRWNVNNYPSTATAASVSQPAYGAGLTPAPGAVNRARHILFSAAGSASAATGLLECVVRDGATGAGTIIWSGVLQAASNASATLTLTDIDLRSSVGNALTAEFTGAGAAGTQLSVSMMGDAVQNGSLGWQS